MDIQCKLIKMKKTKYSKVGKVMKFGNSGAVCVPKAWRGKKVFVMLLEEPNK